MPPFRDGRPEPSNGPPAEMRRGREVRFERTVNVAKSEVDPHRGAGQAEELAKRRARTPDSPHVDRLEFSATDRGSHYEVVVRGLAPESSPQSFAPAGFGDGDARRGPPEHARNEKAGDRRGGGFSLGAGLGFSSGDEGLLSFSGPDAGVDVPARLESRMSINELRRELAGNGHSYPQAAGKRRLAEMLAQREPERARRLLGM